VIALYDELRLPILFSLLLSKYTSSRWGIKRRWRTPVRPMTPVRPVRYLHTPF